MKHSIRRLFLQAASFALAPAFALAQAAEPALERAMAMHATAQAETHLANRSAGAALFVVALVAMALLYTFFRDKRRQDLMGRFVEKGLSVPPELLPSSPSRTAERRRGSLLLALGLGLGFAVYFATDDLRMAAAWGAVLFFLGVASFVNAALFYPDRDR